MLKVRGVYSFEDYTRKRAIAARERKFVKVAKVAARWNWTLILAVVACAVLWMGAVWKL